MHQSICELCKETHKNHCVGKTINIKKFCDFKLNENELKIDDKIYKWLGYFYEAAIKKINLPKEGKKAICECFR